MADHKEAKKAEYVLILKKIDLMYFFCSKPQPYFDVTGHLLVEPMNIETESQTVFLLSPVGGFSVLLVDSVYDLFPLDEPCCDDTGNQLVEQKYTMNVATESQTVSLLSPIGFSFLLVDSSCDLYQVCNGCKSSMVANAAFDQPPAVELTSNAKSYLFYVMFMSFSSKVYVLNFTKLFIY